MDAGQALEPPSPDELLGSLETQVMDVIWERGDATVNDILEALNRDRPRDLAYNSVMTVAARLHRKGLLDRERDGRAFVYSARLAPDDLVAREAEKSASDLVTTFGPVAVQAIDEALRSRPRLRQRLAERLSNTEE